MSSVKVALPAHLRSLARVGSEVQVAVEGDVTVERVLDALESQYPMLRGTIRDHGTHKRRAYMRYYACGEDISHDPDNMTLPAPIRAGEDALIVLGAIAGG
jgi:molybdopterin synthase sulfur carrier subunit